MESVVEFVVELVCCRSAGRPDLEFPRSLRDKYPAHRRDDVGGLAGEGEDLARAVWAGQLGLKGAGWREG